MPRARVEESGGGLDLGGRVAWVTGAGRGIGLSCAEVLTAHGARVVGIDLETTPELSEVAETLVAVDLTDARALDRALSDLAEPDRTPSIVVSNAGVTRDGVIWKLSDEDWDRVLDVNLTGAFRILRAAIPPMRAAGRGGSIVQVGSINGLRGKFGQSAYASAKAGLHGLVRSTAQEVARFGIRVNAVLPGLVDTAMTRSLPAEVRAAAVERILFGRAIAPEEVARVVLFLASDLSSALTGTLLPVDGGQSIA